MRTVMVAATQMACSDDRAENIATAERLVRQAARDGARLILLPELFETPYFCKEMNPAHMALATTLDDNPAIARLRTVAAELQVVLPVSFFERANNVLFNTLAMIDADGTVLGIYRKSHIPDGPGYCEKFYFAPGDTGFRVWQTQVGRVGAAICWDQWFPEAARIMALNGAEILCYPTAIGSEPPDPSLDTSGHWQRVMQGHAAANVMPVIAANRVGTEPAGDATVTFYGTSFIADQSGAIIEQATRCEETVLTAQLDLDAISTQRQQWGLFRDRRPSLYKSLVSLTGGTS